MQKFKGYIKAIIVIIKRLSKFNLKDRWIELTFVIKKILYKKSGKYRPIDSQVLRAYNKHRNNRKNFLLCHAPFKSLRIQADGNVISCCVNRACILSKYPENSLTEIWNGEKLKELRSHIINNDLSQGCNVCYDTMKQKNFHAVPAIFYDEYQIEKDSPIILEFELENTCNLECIMCMGFASSNIREKREKRQPIPKLFNDSFIRDIEIIIPNLRQTHFVGGEPFLINLYYRIWEKIIELNPTCIMVVQTNGTILNDRIKDILDRGNFIIGISLDSVNKEVYEKIRVNANFETTMSNVQYFAEYAKRKGKNLSITVCPMRINWEELPELLSFCNNIGAIISFLPVNSPPSLALWNLPSNELKNIYKFLSVQAITGSGFTTKENKNRYNDYLDQLYVWYKESLDRESNLINYSDFDNKKMEDVVFMKLKDYIMTNSSTINSFNYDGIVESLRNQLSKIKSEKTKNGILISLNNMPIDAVYEILKDTSYQTFLTSCYKDIIFNPLEDEVNFIFKYDK